MAFDRQNSYLAIFLGKRLKQARGGVSQTELARRAGISRPQYNQYERGKSIPSDAVLERIADALNLSIESLIEANNASVVAANVKPIIRLTGLPAQNQADDFISDDYLAVPLLEGRVAAGHGTVVWNDVQSLVWVYKPELRGRHNLFAVQVSGDSMEPTIPDGAIVIIDRDQWQPTGNRRSIWAIRMDNNGDLGIKRLQASEGGLIIISDNFQNYPPSLAWSTDLTKLVIGKVVWMWHSL